MFWIGLLIGYFIMSICCFISLWFFEDGKTNIAILFGGIGVWSGLAVTWFIRQINSVIKHHKYKSLIVVNNEIKYINSNKVDNYLKERTDCNFADWEKYAEQEKWHIEDWKERYITFDEQANVRYAPKCVWEKYRKISQY